MYSGIDNIFVTIVTFFEQLFVINVIYKSIKDDRL